MESALSKIDREVMEIIWKTGGATSPQLGLILGKENGWTSDKIKLYTKRLIEKQLVGTKRPSPRKTIFYPLISKKEYLANDTSKYLSDNYDGLSYMVAGLIENEKISKDEIERLESLIKEYKDKEL